MINFSVNRFKSFPHQPKRSQIGKIIRRSILGNYNNVMINVSIVSLATSQELNLEYRGKDKPTNVISLEYPQSRDEFKILTGELIIADDVIKLEASEQHKTIESHYAHMLVHGMLHLQGYDHQTDTDAEEMEALEIKILASLGYQNPYLEYHENI